MGIQELSMLTALAFMVIILLSGGARTYFKRRFDVSEHLDDVSRALQKNKKAKQRLHSVQTITHH